LMQEARAQSAAELAGADLETQFARLESGSDVDDELAALKAQMTLGPASSPNQPQLPPQQQTTSPKSNEVVDAELDSLRKQLDQM
jgi:phage shock protein A